MITVLPISTWGIPCGIAEHTKHLADELHRQQQGVVVLLPDPVDLNPEAYFSRPQPDHQIVWLNYHAALHSQWTPGMIENLHRLGKKVVVTYHDTGVPNSDQCIGIVTAVKLAGGVVIVHEPMDERLAWFDNVKYIRQGVPAYQGRWQFARSSCATPPDSTQEIYGEGGYLGELGWRFACNNRPVVGTVGFPFPWKNYDLLCEAAALAGWSVLLLAPAATDEQVATWRRLNPWTAIVRRFIPAESVVSYLAGCDATAFLYMCANTGTSGAIRQGLAARKPLMATAGCRQFRDLEEDQTDLLLPHHGIRWLGDLSPQGVARALSSTRITRFDAGIHLLAERDSLINVAKRYTAIFKSVLGHDTSTGEGDSMGHMSKGAAE